MIIKKLNAVNLDRVVEHDKLLRLTEIERYVQEQKEAADLISSTSKEQVKEQIEAARVTTITELQQQNQQLLLATEEKLKHALNSIHSNLASIISHILTKCGILETNPGIIKDLLTSELAKFTDLGELRIKAHPETLEYLTQATSFAGDKVVFEPDSGLDKEVCICETNLWVMNLATNEVKQKIISFLEQDTSH